MKQKWTTWLFNPFMYVAGWQAMAAGILMMVVIAAVATLSSIRFDGVIDIHLGHPLSFVSHIQMILIDYASLCIPLVIAGMILSKSQYRFIDIIGTQLVARWPLVFMGLLALMINLDPIRDAATQLNPEHLDSLFTGPFIIFLCMSVLVTVWMVVLMYRSYAISFNLSGNKAIVSFIVCFILAEVFSKIIIIKLC